MPPPTNSARLATAPLREAAAPRNPALPGPPPARFITGSIRRHILVMTAAGFIGILAVFAGDLFNLLFLAQTHDTEILAAIGYASTLFFFTIAISIGLSIGATAAVSPAIGAGRLSDARRLATSAVVTTALVGAALALAAWPVLSPLLASLGATGRTQALATDYLQLVLPAYPLHAIGMTSSALLRSVGDARRSMFVMLTSAIGGFALDAIFIYGLGWGLRGAALSWILSFLASAAVGITFLWRRHRLFGPLDHSRFRPDIALLMTVSIPAIVTNLATPTNNAIVTKALADHGDAAIAAWSVWGRISPCAFSAIFAMGHAVGPIVGQNFGAKDFARVRETILEAGRIIFCIILAVWGVHVLIAAPVTSVFALGQESARLVTFAMRWVTPLFFFLGLLFVSNAVFNTLRYPHYATLFNWGRATLGTVPFVAIGAKIAGAAGIIAGSLASALVIGLAAYWFSLRLVDRLEQQAKDPTIPNGRARRPPAQIPQGTLRA
jgi:putative MATE family efflux protein